MNSPVGALRASVDRLHKLAGALSDEQVASPSYCDDWSIAQVLSHLGSGAVISLRGLQDAQAGISTPEGFNQSVWDEWDAKSPRAQADDALAADEALIAAYEAADDDERARLTFAMGPLSLSFDQLVGLRLNEHTFHSWDIAVMAEPGARLPDDATELVVDNLGLIARFSGRPDGQECTIAVRTTEPGRDFALHVSADGVELAPGDPGQSPDLELPAEAFSRLLYGRLDPDHTSAFTGDAGLVASLRAVFPGP